MNTGFCAFGEIVCFLCVRACKSLSQQQHEQAAVLGSSVGEEGLPCLPQPLLGCWSGRRQKSLTDAKIARSQRDEAGFGAAAGKRAPCNEVTCSERSARALQGKPCRYGGFVLAAWDRACQMNEQPLV